MEMLGSVAIRRVITTADVAARPAQPQVHPLRAGFQALLAAASTRPHVADRIFVTAFSGHGCLGRLSELVDVPDHVHSWAQLIRKFMQRVSTTGRIHSLGAVISAQPEIRTDELHRIVTDLRSAK
jgi:hypothetical protein